MTVDEIVKLFETSGFTAMQAERIIRTEVGRAANTGVKAAASGFNYEMVKEWIANEVSVPVNPIINRDGKVQPVDAHRVGSAITYGRRYSLSALLAIGEASDTDDDGNNASGYQNQSQAPQQPLRQPQTPQKQAPKTPAPTVPAPLDRFNAEIDRLWGKETSKADRKGIHNAVAAGGSEVPITKDSLSHVADCLSECKDKAEADVFITGCLEANE